MSIKLADAWKIIDLTLNNNTGMRSMPSPNIGLLQLLTSSANRAASRVKLGNVQAIDRGDGKVYKVSRSFFPRLGQVNNASVEYCPTDGDVIKPLYDEVEIKNQTVSRKIKIDDELMRCIKENRADYQNAYINEVLRNHINLLGQQVSTVVGTNGYIGGFPKCDCDSTPAACLDLPLFISTGLGINPVGESILDSIRKQAEIDQQLVLVGGTLLDQYRKARAIASGNDNGFDASLLDITRSIYYDTHVPAAMGGNNKIIAMAPGALQLITYAKNQGQFSYEFEDQMRTTVVDPWLGLTHDVYMSYSKCNAEIELYIQFVTNWAVVGMPKCWSADDCLLENVLDVFCFDVVCADTGYCDIEAACGKTSVSAPTTAVFCDSAELCVSPCDAGFVSECGGTYNVFNYVGVTYEEVSAVVINGIPISLGGTFDLTTSSGGNAFMVALQAALANIPSILSVSGGWNGTETVANIVTNNTILTISLFDNAAGYIALYLEVSELCHIVSTSVASTGATLTNLDWTAPGPVTFDGAPGATIFTAGFVGTYSNFFTDTTGAYQLVITDSVDCTDTYNATV